MRYKKAGVGVVSRASRSTSETKPNQTKTKPNQTKPEVERLAREPRVGAGSAHVDNWIRNIFPR